MYIEIMTKKEYLEWLNKVENENIKKGYTVLISRRKPDVMYEEYLEYMKAVNNEKMKQEILLKKITFRTN